MPAHPTVNRQASKLAEQLKKSLGLSDEFDMEVRNSFRGFLADAYWKPIHAYISKEVGGLKSAVRTADVDSSTLSRWLKKKGGTTAPDFKTICLLFSMCNLNLREVEFPSPEKAIEAARRQSIDFVRTQHLGIPQASLGVEEWYCLCQVLERMDVLKKALAEDGADAKSVTGRWYEECEAIAAVVCRHHPTSHICTAEMVLKTTEDWIRPVLLHFTVIHSLNLGADHEI